MKKILSLLTIVALAFVSLFTLAACTEDNSIPVFIFRKSDPYIGVVSNLLAKEMQKRNLSVNLIDADGNQDTQSNQIDAALARGSKLLIVNIVEKASASTIIKKAKDNNATIIFFNREVDDEDIRSYDRAAFVGTDPDEAGYKQGQLIADLLKGDNFAKWDKNKDGKISYFMLRADLDNPEANGRTKYSVQEANRLLTEAKHPVLSQIGVDTNAAWDNAQAKGATDSILSKNPPTHKTEPLELVIANNDGMAEGAVASLQALGYNTSTKIEEMNPEKTVLVVGVDAVASAVQKINQGQMAGSVKQDGEKMAIAVAELAKNASENKKDFTEGTEFKYAPSLVDSKPVNKVRIPYGIVTK